MLFELLEIVIKWKRGTAEKKNNYNNNTNTYSSHSYKWNNNALNENNVTYTGMNTKYRKL